MTIEIKRPSVKIGNLKIGAWELPKGSFFWRRSIYKRDTFICYIWLDDPPYIPSFKIKMPSNHLPDFIVENWQEKSYNSAEEAKADFDDFLVRMSKITSFA